MSWHCSRALVAEYLAANYSDGERYAQSSTTPTPEAYYWPDKTTEHSRLSRFGMTSEPLTERLGEGMLMWFREAFHVRTSAQPEKAQGLTESAADYGQRWQGSLAKYNRDSRSWRTAQCSLVEGLDEFSETWPRWGSMRNGVSYLRQMPAHLTCGSESGSWPTPRANDAEKRGNFDLSNPRNGLPAAVRMWPTPCSNNGTGGATGLAGGAGNRKKLYKMLGYEEGKKMGCQSLNPYWVEWLMGWPIGWTDLKPLGTAKFQEWLQQHGESLPMNEAA